MTYVHCTLLRGFNFSGIFCTINVAWPSCNSSTKNHEDRPRGSPPTGALNARGSDVNKDLTFKAKDKDQTLKAKDQDKD